MSAHNDYRAYGVIWLSTSTAESIDARSKRATSRIIKRKNREIAVGMMELSKRYKTLTE